MRGRAIAVATSPIVPLREPTLDSIGVPDARKQRMTLTNAQEGTETWANHICECSAGRFPDDGGQQYGSARRLQTCTLHLSTGQVLRAELESSERRLAPVIVQVSPTSLVAHIRLQKEPPGGRLLDHHVGAKRLDSQPGENEAFPRTVCPVCGRGRSKIFGQSESQFKSQVCGNSTISRQRSYLLFRYFVLLLRWLCSSGVQPQWTQEITSVATKQHFFLFPIASD